MSTRVYPNTLIERLQDAIEKGIVEVAWTDSDEPSETVRFTSNELIRFLVIMWPEEHLSNITAKMPRPTDAPPGTERKIREMRDRIARGESPCHPNDADLKEAEIHYTGPNGEQVFERTDPRVVLMAARKGLKRRLVLTDEQIRGVMSLKGIVSERIAAERFGIKRGEVREMWSELPKGR